MSLFRAVYSVAAACAILAAGTTAQTAPPGKLVDLGGHRLHIDCRGEGSLTVVVENGFDEFSFDWALVRAKVEKFARICTYDRAGYAWSEPGPAPRTFDQINLELHDGLEKLDERGPFVLVGHSFGGPIVRNYVIRYPGETAGIVFVDAVSEDQRFEMWRKAVRILQPCPHAPDRAALRSSARGIAGAPRVGALATDAGGSGGKRADVVARILRSLARSSRDGPVSFDSAAGADTK